MAGSILSKVAVPQVALKLHTFFFKWPRWTAALAKIKVPAHQVALKLHILFFPKWLCPRLH